MLRLLLPLALAFPLFAQEVLTNDSIVKLVKAGLGDDLIINMIKTQGSKFALGADDVIALKAAGVSEKVVSAMIVGSSGGSTPKTEPQKDGPALPDELGVYRHKDGKYVPLMPEILNLRTARAGAVFTSGIVAAKLNGWVVNQHSPNRVGPETEFLVRLPEGTDAAEYVCLRFEKKDDRREVELGRGRINVSFSTHRAAIPFQSEKLGKGLFRLKFGVFKNGEYGLLPPGANLAANAASAGKIYTFLVE
jgi:hypothetical protein